MEVINRPNSATDCMPQGATVPFYIYDIGDSQIVEFDTSMCEPPEPMVNAMVGLKMVDKSTKLLMINHKMPMKLFEKLGEDYDIETADMADGRVQILFSFGDGKRENIGSATCHCDG